MNTLRLSLLAVIFSCVTQVVTAQSSFSTKVEAGYNLFYSTIVNVDPGPNWKGDYHPQKDGWDINLVQEYKMSNTLFLGAGVGYKNFEGVNGMSIFADAEYIPLKTKVSPLLNLRVGYNHLWNQYENGTGTALGEVSLGLNYQMSDRVGIYARYGIELMQMSMSTPIRIGFRYQ